MDISRKKFTFTQQAKGRLDLSVRPIFDDLVKEWTLFEWEDALVFQFFPLGEDDVVDEDALSNVDDLIKYLRGEDSTKPFAIDELNTIDWKNSLETDVELVKRLFRTVYVCINKDDRSLAIALRFTLDPFMIIHEAAGGSESDPNIREIIIRPYIILCAYFFFLLPNTLSFYLFESGFVLLGLKLGFDWEAIVRDTTDRMMSLNLRKNLCIELSASLSNNHTILGQDINSLPKDVKYWIDNFRIFSKKEFGGQDLFGFLNDDNYFGGCKDEDKDLISQMLQLYTHLINGYLIVPNGDLSAVDKRVQSLEKSGTVENKFVKEEVKLDLPVLGSSNKKNKFTVFNEDIRKMILSELGYTPDGQYENLEEIFSRLAELAIYFNRPEIADLYYFDEQQNKFVWKP